jgi:hypothetical protein
MRSSRTKIKGKIGLIESGTGLIVGEANLIGCSPHPVPKLEYLKLFHQIENLDLLDKWHYAWYLEKAKRYNKPIPYTHPKGAVIWVKNPFN